MQILVVTSLPQNIAAWSMAHANQSAPLPPNERSLAGLPAQYYPVDHSSFGRYILDTSVGEYQLSYRPVHYHYLALNSRDPLGNLNDWLHHEDPQQRAAFAQQVYQDFVASFNLGPHPPWQQAC